MQRIDLEGELRLQEQHITNALKDNIVLKQQLAQKPAQRSKHATYHKSR
jgi:hypothetical protein